MNLTDFEHEQGTPDRFLASEEFRDQMYVVVNTTYQYWENGYPILGKHASKFNILDSDFNTLSSIEEAVERVVDYADQHHDLDSAEIYRLVPVKRTEELEKLYEEKLEEYEYEKLEKNEYELEAEKWDLSGFYEKEYSSETPIIFETLITSDSKLLEIFNLNNETFDA